MVAAARTVPCDAGGRERRVCRRAILPLWKCSIIAALTMEPGIAEFDHYNSSARRGTLAGFGANHGVLDHTKQVSRAWDLVTRGATLVLTETW